MNEILSETITAIAVPLGICVVLPVMVVWLITLKMRNDTNKRTEILLAAIQKNSQTDIEDLLKKITPKQKSIKEKLFDRLHRGCVLSITGIVASAYFYKLDANLTGIFLIATAIGGSFILNYFIGMKKFSKEINANDEDADSNTKE